MVWNVSPETLKPGLLNLASHVGDSVDDKSDHSRRCKGWQRDGRPGMEYASSSKIAPAKKELRLDRRPSGFKG